MRKIIAIAAIALASCKPVPKETIHCRIKEVRKVGRSTIEEYNHRFVIITDCGWAASTNKIGLKPGDTVSFRVPKTH